MDYFNYVQIKEFDDLEMITSFAILLPTLVFVSLIAIAETLGLNNGYGVCIYFRIVQKILYQARINIHTISYNNYNII